MNSKKSKAPELGFVDLTTVDSRDKVREVSLGREERLHKVDIDIIHLRPGEVRKSFNWRLQQDGEPNVAYEERLGIPALAIGIYESNGPDDPIRGDFKLGLFFPTEGERRVRAIRYILNVMKLKEYPNGSSVRVVEVLINPKWFTDDDRRRVIFTSQDKLKLSPMELAYGFAETKASTGKSNEELAKQFNLSRQSIDNYIAATKLDKATQEEINLGKMPLSTALKHKRQEDAKNKQAEAVVDEIPETPTWRKDQTDKDLEDSELLPPQDNSVSSSSTRLKEDKGSAAIVYNEPEEEIWKRAIKMMSSLQEQEKSAEYIISELKLSFQISNRK